MIERPNPSLVVKQGKYKMLASNPDRTPPGNESETHFLLKQVAQAFLKTNFHCSIVGTEVHTGNHRYPELKKDYPEYTWSRRKVTDAIGIKKNSRKDVDNLIRNIEVKVSNQDLKSGYSLSGDYNYILAPRNEIYKDFLFPFVGLIEVDLNRLKWPKNKTMGTGKDIVGVDITKNPRMCEYGQHHDYRDNWVSYLKRAIMHNHVNDKVYRNLWFYPGFGS